MSVGVTQHTKDTEARTPLVTGQHSWFRPDSSGERTETVGFVPRTFLPPQATSVLRLKFSCYIS